jgi:signal peptidase I
VSKTPSPTGAASHSSAWQRWERGVVAITERYLSWRRVRRVRRKIRMQGKHPLLDWAEAIGSAILIVLVINQFLLQAYRIPSESMVPTLLVGDRIFVNKLIYGPELIPGSVKLPSPRLPRRGEVIIFENPTYVAVGPALELVQRVIYMATLSLVNIDTDDQGRPRAHFLIKRAIGMPGDRVRVRGGDVEIMVGGAGPWRPERELMQELGLPYNVRRLFPQDSYPDLRLASMARVRAAAGMRVSAAEATAAERIRDIGRVDYSYSNTWIARARYELDPHSHAVARDWRRLEHGWQVPDDAFMPMGDNRDDSRDSRDFGPVKLNKVLGQALFHYWPPSRWAAVR